MILRFAAAGLALTITFAGLGQMPATQPARLAPAEAAARAPAPQSEPLSPEQVLEVARAKYQAGQTGEALDMVKRLLEAIPNHIEANLLAAELLIAGNDYSLARTFYLKVLESEAANFKANLGIGRIWLDAGYWRQALAYLEKAEAVAPESGRAEAKRLLASNLLQLRRLNDALNKIQEAIAADPTDLEARQILVRIRMELARMQADVERMRPLLSQAREDANKCVQLATTLAEGDPWNPTRLRQLQSAFQLRLEVLDAYHKSLYERSLHGETIDRLRPGLGPEAAEALNQIAEYRRQLGLLQIIMVEHDALVYLETAVSDRYDPRNPHHLGNLAATYLQIEDLTARLVGRGVFADRKMHERAAETYRKVLEFDPQNEPARRFLESAAAAAITPQP